jgi:uncharacterized protein (TIGR01777 family)
MQTTALIQKDTRMATRIVITGATGFIGQRVVSALRDLGAGLVVLSRHPDRAARELQPVERSLLWLPGVDGAWREAIDGADAVIHLAGESVAGKRWTPAFKRQVLDSRVRGTRDIATAISRAGTPPPVFISASGVGYYGDTGDALMTENAPHGAGFLAEVCRDWEREAFNAESAATRVVLLRTGLVLAHDAGALPRLAVPFSFFAGGPLGSGRQWFPWIHADDAIQAILHCLHAASLRGPVNLVAPQLVRNSEFCSALGHALHRPSWFRVPAFALRIAVGGFAETLLGGQRAVPEALLTSGYTFRHPRLDEALASMYLRP